MRRKPFCVGLWYMIGLLVLCSVINNKVFAQQIRDSSSLVQEGQLYYSQANESNEPDENICFMEMAMPFFEAAKNWEQALDCKNELAKFLYYKEAYNASFSAMDDAEQFAIQYQLEQTSAYQTTIGNLGIKYETLGNLDLAVAYTQKAITLTTKGTGPDYTPVYYHNIGYFKRQQGDYEHSLNYLEQAKALYIELWGHDHMYMPAVYMDIAKNYKALGAYSKAITNLEASLQALSKLDGAQSDFFAQTEWDCYQKLSEIYLSLGDPKLATKYAQAAIDIQEQNPNYTIAYDYKSYLSLGEVYLFNEDFAAAISCFEKAEQAAKKETAGQAIDVGLSYPYDFLAKIHLQKQEYLKALEASTQAINACINGDTLDSWAATPKLESLPQEKKVIDLLSRKIDILYAYYENEKQDGDILKHAYETTQLAAEAIKQTRQLFVEQGSKHKLAEHVIPIYEKGIKIALALYQTTNDKAYLEQAFELAERNKANTLIEDLQENLAKGFGQIPQELLEKEKNLRGEIAFYEKTIEGYSVPLNTADSLNAEKLKTLLFEKKQALTQLLQLFEEDYPKFAKLKYAESIKLIDAIQKKHLQKGQAIVEYFVGEENTFVFALTHDELFVEEINNTNKLEAKVTELLSIINRPPSSKNFNTDIETFDSIAFYLYSELMAPVLSHLPKNIRQLAIIPDDYLSYLPFEVLIQQKMDNNKRFEDAQYLLRDYAISYNYSARLLLQENATNIEKDLGLIGFAPSFGTEIASASRNCNELVLSGLACNEMEISQIGALFPGHLKAGQLASLNTFLQQAHQFGLIHLATHACVDETNPKNSKIFFQEEALTGYELANLNLNAKLVTLSACNTGVGQLAKGEGVLSLSRAFKLAGSESMLTSLWAVDDCNTSNLMVQFYTCLKSGLGKDESLRQSKLEHLKKATKETAHPYFWAPFVQYGDVERVVNKPSLSPYMLVGGVLVLIAVVVFLRRKSTR